MEHLSHYKAISPLPGSALLLFSAEDQLFAESFLPNLSSWQLLQRHVTGLVAGPSDCWALEWQRGESGESVDVKLCFAHVDRSGQVDGESFFVPSSDIYIFCFSAA